MRLRGKERVFGRRRSHHRRWWFDEPALPIWAYLRHAFWDTVIFLSFFPFCFAIYTEFYFEHKHNIIIGIFTFLLFHGYNKCEFDAKINLNFFCIIIV